VAGGFATNPTLLPGAAIRRPGRIPCRHGPHQGPQQMPDMRLRVISTARPATGAAEGQSAVRAESTHDLLLHRQMAIGGKHRQDGPHLASGCSVASA